MELKKKAELISGILSDFYPEHIQFIRFRNNFELLISVILSAQTTDEQVMSVTPALFSKFPTPESLAQAEVGDIEEIIRPVGFFHTKAKNIKATGKELVERFGGAVPSTIEELVTLPGVGRKTANVVVGTAFSQPAVIVDTHFKRVTMRLGLTKNTDPDKIEADIRSILKKEKLYRFSMTANLHGRRCCHARKPECEGCILKAHCNYFTSLK